MLIPPFSNLIRHCFICNSDLIRFHYKTHIKGHSEDIKKLKISNNLVDNCKTACKVCGKILNLYGMRCHTKKHHGITIKEYKNRYNQQYFDIIEKVFHLCGVCQEIILLDCDHIHYHLRNHRSNKSHRMTFKEYNDVFMNRVHGSAGKWYEPMEQIPKDMIHSPEPVEQTRIDMEPVPKSMEKTPMNMVQTPELTGKIPIPFRQNAGLIKHTPMHNENTPSLIRATPRPISQTSGLLGQTPRLFGQTLGYRGLTPRPISLSLASMGQTPRPMGQTMGSMKQTPRTISQSSESVQQTSIPMGQTFASMEQTPRTMGLTPASTEQTTKPICQTIGLMGQLSKKMDQTSESNGQTPIEIWKTHAIMGKSLGMMPSFYQQKSRPTPESKPRTMGQTPGLTRQTFRQMGQDPKIPNLTNNRIPSQVNNQELCGIRNENSTNIISNTQGIVTDNTIQRNLSMLRKAENSTNLLSSPIGNILETLDEHVSKLSPDILSTRTSLGKNTEDQVSRTRKEIESEIKSMFDCDSFSEKTNLSGKRNTVALDEETVSVNIFREFVSRITRPGDTPSSYPELEMLLEIDTSSEDTIVETVMELSRSY